MTDTGQQPQFALILPHLPMPRPLEQHDHRERARREHLAALLQNPKLTVYRMHRAEFRSLMQGDGPPEPRQGAPLARRGPVLHRALPQPLELYHDAVEEALGAPGDLLYGVHV